MYSLNIFKLHSKTTSPREILLDIIQYTLRVPYISSKVFFGKDVLESNSSDLVQNK